MSIISGILGYKAAGDASDAQLEAGDKAAATQLEMFYQSRADTAPWRSAGEWALSQLVGTPATPEKTVQTPIYGTQQGGGTTQAGQQAGQQPDPNTTLSILQNAGFAGPFQDAQSAANWLYQNGAIPTADPYLAVNYLAQAAGQSPEGYSIAQYALNAGQSAIGPVSYETTTIPATEGTPGLIVPDPGKNFTTSPGYEWRLGQGINALDKSAAARGRTGGAHEKALIEYGQNYASNEYDKYLQQYYQSLNPYMSLAGLGQVSAGQSASGAIQTGQNLAENALYQGSARASGYINQANAISSGIGDIGNMAVAAKYLGWI